MPEVSTTIRSKPATFTAASTSGRAALISEPKSLVANERMKTRGPSFQGAMAFMRMRSPSRAPPALAPRRVDRDHGDLQRIVLIEAQTPDQLVGEARFAGAARAGDADDRRPDRRRHLAELATQRLGGTAVL